MFLNDSNKTRISKLKEMSSMECGVIDIGSACTLETSLCAGESDDSLFSQMLTLSNNGELSISLFAYPDKMFKKYRGLKGSDLFNDMITENLSNTILKTGRTMAQTHYESDGDSYEYSVYNLKASTYEEVIELFDSMAEVASRAFTRNTIL